MNVFESEETKLEVPRLKQIASLCHKTITFYDLETTTFLGVPTFGITEVAALHIHPTGEITQQFALVNPENPISEKASAITGITDDMVVNQPNWADIGLPFFEYWAHHHILMGFNNLAFDDKAVFDQNRRYGGSDSFAFKDSRDVRSFWRLMQITKNGRGKLGDIAAMYGLSPEGAHRAIFDVRMTARIFDFMLLHKGIDFFNHPGGVLPAHKRLESLFMLMPGACGSYYNYVNHEERILHLIKVCRYTDFKRLMFLAGLSEFVLSSMLGDMVYNDVLDYDIVLDSLAQDWLAERVPFIIEKAWGNEKRGQLKIIFDIIEEQTRFGVFKTMDIKPDYVDFLQLRIFLKAHGYYAAIDKTGIPMEDTK